MKKLATGFMIIIILVGILPQVTIAGDESNPEIVDDEKDVRMWFVFKGPIVNALFKNIDIVSCWFHEDSEEPEYFYITVKLRAFRFSFLNTTYAVQWYYNNLWCFAILGNKLKEEHIYANIGYVDNATKFSFETSAEADEAENTLTVTVPKNCVGNPNPGDVLNEPFAGTFVFPNLEVIVNRLPFLSILAYDEALEGSDYTIQY